jgi:hypothetical protein
LLIDVPFPGAFGRSGIDCANEKNRDCAERLKSEFIERTVAPRR